MQPCEARMHYKQLLLSTTYAVPLHRDYYKLIMQSNNVGSMMLSPDMRINLQLLCTYPIMKVWRSYADMAVIQTVPVTGSKNLQILFFGSRSTGNICSFYFGWVLSCASPNTSNPLYINFYCLSLLPRAPANSISSIWQKKYKEHAFFVLLSSCDTTNLSNQGLILTKKWLLRKITKKCQHI